MGEMNQLSFDYLVVASLHFKLDMRSNVQFQASIGVTVHHCLLWVLQRRHGSSFRTVPLRHEALVSQFGWTRTQLPLNSKRLLL